MRGRTLVAERQKSQGWDFGPGICGAPKSSEATHETKSDSPMGWLNLLRFRSPAKSQCRGDDGSTLLFHKGDKMLKVTTHIAQLEPQRSAHHQIVFYGFSKKVHWTPPGRAVESATSGRGLFRRTKRRRFEKAGRSLCRYVARALPISAGKGSRATRPAFPRMVISPTCQWISSKVRATISHA